MKISGYRTLKLFLLALAAGSFIVTIAPAKHSYAAYDSGRLIDNSVFLDAASMSRDNIQSFLASKNSGLINRSFVFDCASTGMSATYYQSAGAPCGQTVPASTIIYYTAQIYGISPKVVLATLQKEQSLVTNPYPSDWNINQAMGYGCPDSGGCGASTFLYQLDNGVWLLRYHMERARGNMDYWFRSTSWVCGSPKNYYKPSLYPLQNVSFYDDAGVLYRTEWLANAATSSMYCYTPHTYNNPRGLYGLPVYGTTGQYYSGSYNFVSYYERWFGPTTGSGYAWSIENFSYFTGDNHLAPGQVVTATLKARNTSAYPWYNHGNNPVYLATWEPADSKSKLYTQGWPSPNRVALLQESGVAPGQVGTFVFPISVPSTGTFTQSLNLVAENATFMDWPGFRPTLYGVAPYQWNIEKVIYENGTGLMMPGSNQLITVIAKNTGSKTWSNTEGPRIKLGTWEPQRISKVVYNWPSSIRAAHMNESSVAPGQTAGFQFWVTVPSEGYFYERMNLVAEGETWFNDAGLTLYLKGGSYAWQTAWTSLSTGGYTVDKGSTFTVTIRAKNTGDMTWSRTSGPPIRVGTAEPLNRGSNLYNPESWLRDTRATSLIEENVPPGQEGTFSFQAKAPAAPGYYYEPFGLVAEGQIWLTGKPIVLPLTVR